MNIEISELAVQIYNDLSMQRTADTISRLVATRNRLLKSLADARGELAMGAANCQELFDGLKEERDEAEEKAEVAIKYVQELKAVLEEQAERVEQAEYFLAECHKAQMPLKTRAEKAEGVAIEYRKQRDAIAAEMREMKGGADQCPDATKLIPLDALIAAVNASCSCGGRVAGNPDACPACNVLHRIGGAS